MNYKATIKHPEDLTRYNYTFNGEEWVSDGPRLIVSEFIPKSLNPDDVTIKEVISFCVITYLFVMALGYVVGMLLW